MSLCIIIEGYQIIRADVRYILSEYVLLYWMWLMIQMDICIIVMDIIYNVLKKSEKIWLIDLIIEDTTLYEIIM